MNNDWMNRRQRAIHMTTRGIDCGDFDVPATIATFKRWGVTLFSFFAAGYITTYPSRLPWAKVAPQLNGRDLCGEILREARAAGIRTFPAIDLGELPTEEAEKHPDWAARKPDGSLQVKTNGIVTSCPLGAYQRRCSEEAVAELLQRYGDLVDGIKWGGGSYGFPVCHCDTCRAAYRADTGSEMPADAKDDTYRRWRNDMAKKVVRSLVEMVHQHADIPVVGNSVWHLGRGMEIDDHARDQDFVQVEIQTRTNIWGDDDDPSWERFSTPIETTRYISRLTRRPPWVVASYFLAWPWRRVAVPVPEQKVYLAQVAANGGSPMVNLTNSSPKHHEDPRGFPAIESLYNFMERNADLYDADHSGATVAIVYDPDSAALARRRGRDFKDYLHDLHACENALDRLHLPYDIINAESLSAGEALTYSAYLLPSATALPDAAITRLAQLVAAGAGVVMTGDPGATNVAGDPRDRSAICDLLGVTNIGAPRRFMESHHLGPIQAYARVADAHPILAGIEAPLVAMVGQWCPVELAPSASAPLVRAAPFRLFPEGMAHPDTPDPGEPLVVVRETRGRTVYFPFAAGRCAARTGHPDNDALIANALAWAAVGNVPVRLDGWPDVRVSVRLQPGRTNVHLINTTGRRRYLTQYTPLRDLPLRIACRKKPAHARLASGASLPVSWDGAWASVRVPELVDYDIVVLEQ